MSQILENLKAISLMIDQRIERERDVKAIKDLTKKFSNLNNPLRNVILSGRFLFEIKENSELTQTLQELEKNYLDISTAIISVWGTSPKVIDILDTQDISKALDSFNNSLDQTEEIIKKTLTDITGGVEEDYKIIKTYSEMLPEIEVDLQSYKEVDQFLKANASSYNKFCNYTAVKGKREDKIRQWKRYLQKISEEHEKLDFKGVPNLSPETKKVLHHLLKYRKIPFEQLNGSIIEEIRQQFPLLSKKLELLVAS